MKLSMRRDTCPTCQQQIIPPTPSKVVLIRVGMAAFAVASGLVEYRRAVRRELEQLRLEQLHETSPDVPLDEHLDQRDPSGAGDARRDPANPFDVVRSVDLYENGEHVASSGPIATPWPPSHPSLAADDDASAVEQ